MRFTLLGFVIGLMSAVCPGEGLSLGYFTQCIASQPFLNTDFFNNNTEIVKQVDVSPCLRLSGRSACYLTMTTVNRRLNKVIGNNFSKISVTFTPKVQLDNGLVFRVIHSVYNQYGTITGVKTMFTDTDVCAKIGCPVYQGAVATYSVQYNSTEAPLQVCQGCYHQLNFQLLMSTGRSDAFCFNMDSLVKPRAILFTNA